MIIDQLIRQFDRDITVVIAQQRLNHLYSHLNVTKICDQIDWRLSRLAMTCSTDNSL